MAEGPRLTVALVPTVARAERRPIESTGAEWTALLVLAALGVVTFLLRWRRQPPAA